MKQATYPGASKVQWFAETHKGDPMSYPLEKWLWHSTETSGWPGYSGGGSAPTMTVMFDFAAKKMNVRAHFPANMSARALQNDSGGVQTNRDNLVQVEIVGTCDPDRHKKSPTWPYIPELPDWCLKELAKLAVWGHEEWGIPLTSGVVWTPYPRSYGDNAGQRLSKPAFNAYRGHLGHQHAAENDHGDPGNLNMARVLAFASDLMSPTTKGADIMATPEERAALVTTLLDTKIDTYLDKDGDKKTEPATIRQCLAAAWSLTYMTLDEARKNEVEDDAAVVALDKRIDALDKKLDSIVALLTETDEG